MEFSVSDLQDIKKENERLYKVLDVNAFISSSLDLEFVLDTIMEKAREVTEAEASSLMLLDYETDELYFHTVKGESDEALKNVRLKLGEGISGWAAREKKPVLVEDCYKDERFSRKGDSVSRFVTRSMMCVPLVFQEKVLGTIQVLNRQDGGFFNHGDLKILQTLAVQAGIAIQNARLHERATRDAMTGLYMKGYFLACLEDSYRESIKENKKLSLLMSDIDLFKKVNDNYGHQGGDAALVALARVMLETVERERPGAMAGRYGGEEFCVFIPDGDEREAFELAEKIRKNIESTTFDAGGKEAKITISLGISAYPGDDRWIGTPEDMIRLADEALYTSKAKGRNCVSTYQEHLQRLEQEKGSGPG